MKKVNENKRKILRRWRKTKDLLDFFKTAKQLNEQNAELLSRNKSFLSEIKKIRSHFSIPELNLMSDVILVDLGKYTDALSNWVETFLSKKQKVKLQERIFKILEKFCLPINFYDWVEHWILYNRRPPWAPIFNFDLIENYDKLSPLTPMTIGEKQFLKWYIRRTLKLKRKGRIPKKISQAYREILTNLSKIKNTRRRLRNFEVGLRALTFKPKTIMYYDYTEEKNIYTKTSLRNLAEQIADKKFRRATKADYRKIYQNLRKAKERIENQIDMRFKRKVR